MTRLFQNIYLFLSLALLSTVAFSQKNDSTISKLLKWPPKDREQTFITKLHDTLNTEFESKYYPDFGTIIKNYNRVNSRLNGQSTLYHNNGKVLSIIFYLDNKPWESIFLADSNGNVLKPGTLKNGSGTINYINEDGSELGYINYKNGNTEGKYHFLREAHGKLAIEGELSYNERLIKYDTSNFIRFIFNGDTLTAVIVNGQPTDSVSKLVQTSKANLNFKIINSETFVEQKAGTENKFLHIFLDPGVYPVGHWQLFDIYDKKIYANYEFDQVGKMTLYISYNADGTIFQRRTF